MYTSLPITVLEKDVEYGDNHDLLQRLQSSPGASANCNSNCDDLFFPASSDGDGLSIHSCSQSLVMSNSQLMRYLHSSDSWVLPPMQPQSQPVLDSTSAHSHLQGLQASLHSSTSSQLQLSLSKVPLTSQSGSLLWSNSQPYPEVYQTSFLPQNLSQSSFVPTSAPQSVSSIHNPFSRYYFEESTCLNSSFREMKEETSPSSSSIRCIGVSMIAQESSLSCPNVSGHSFPSLPPISPSMMNPHYSATRRGSFYVRQLSDNSPVQMGDRRVCSEIPFRFSSGGDSPSDMAVGQGLTIALDKELVRELKMEKDGVEIERDMLREKCKGVGDVRKGPACIMNVNGEMMEVAGDKEGEGRDGLFSMDIIMEKMDGFPNSGTEGILESSKQTGSVQSMEQWEMGHKGREIFYSDQDEDRPGFSSSSKVDSLQEGTDSGAESEKDGGVSRIGIQGKDATATSAEGEAKSCFEENNDEEKMKVECESNHSLGSFHNSQNATMDGLIHSLIGGEDALEGGPSQGQKIRHIHSHSMDGSYNLKMEFGKGEFDAAEIKKITAIERLSEIALADPKRAKRILANRQSAARSKERKMLYMSELEKKVQTLQNETIALSARLTLLQRDSSGVTNENIELTLKLQAMNQRAQIYEALNETLGKEVQRLKLAAGQQIPVSQELFQMSQQLGPQPSLQQLQQTNSCQVSPNHSNLLEKTFSVTVPLGTQKCQAFQ